MIWYQWLSIGALAICIFSLMLHFIKIIRLGKPTDYSEKRGDVAKAITYSMSGAMSPKKKESAFLHLPTYTAGIIYHIGIPLEDPLTTEIE